MRFRKLRIAWSVGCGYRVRAADRVVGAELLARVTLHWSYCPANWLRSYFHVRGEIIVQVTRQIQQ